ncbi:HAD-IIIA family hydrolase [Paenibacillus sp. MMS18-CY102]|uniref:HAD-IIIA family hydrolase n=1 Tax=Paenibacillus sp. MMS18-CY102 TaxID=2682849 RepID=UPI0013652D04|nr:HAD-IIIA family hydrolase [Paenibacillus sp. MMS18-CY102]MWC28113.1 HAD-IIIA family hydrolase [Paenibacillus sp. MMS18-CY102]
MKAVIMAGGKGTRLGERTLDTPKPLVPVHGKPVLEHQIDNFARYGIREIWVVVGHLGEQIEQHLGDGSQYGVSIRYIREDRPLGTAGALHGMKEALGESFVLAYGDVVFDVNLYKMIDYHYAHHWLGTLAVHPNNHPYDSDVLKVGVDGAVQAIYPKNEARSFDYRNCVNAGLFVLRSSIIDHIAPDTKQDLEKDVLTRLIKEGAIGAYKTTEYMKDMGTPDRFDKVQAHMAQGVVHAKNLSQKQRAIFLDRDGTINRYAGLVSHPDELELEHFVVDALKRINDSPFLCIVITNQPVVARNMCTEEEVEHIHDRMETLLGNEGAYVDDILYCPHHPDRGYPEENIAYKVACSCRKPDIGMLMQAASRYNIDLSASYFIGDTTVDIQTGFNAQTTTVLLGTGLGGSDNKYAIAPDYTAQHLLEAVDGILSGAFGPRSESEYAQHS